MHGPSGEAATGPLTDDRRAESEESDHVLTGWADRAWDALARWRILRRLMLFLDPYREQVLYLVVGGWNTVFGYASWALCQYLLGPYLPYLVVLVLSWPIAVLNNYFGYRYIVFRSRGPIWRELPRFCLVYAATLAVNLALLPIALRMIPLNIYIVQGLFTIVVIILSYLSNKYFSFGGSRRATSTRADRPTR